MKEHPRVSSTTWLVAALISAVYVLGGCSAQRSHTETRSSAQSDTNTSLVPSLSAPLLNSPLPQVKVIKPAPSPQQGDGVAWKIYSNDSYGYKIRIPSDAGIDTTIPEYPREVGFIGGTAIGFRIVVAHNPQALSPKNWFEKLKRESAVKQDAINEGGASIADLAKKEESITIGSLTGYKVTAFAFDHDEEHVYFTRSRLAFEIIYGIGGDPNGITTPIMYSTYKKMLQSFEFIPITEQKE